MLFLDIIFYTFIVIVLIQVIFYSVFFGKFAFFKHKKESQKNIAVSVLICAKNEAENLQNFLPSILSQDYPNFEIVLINDASNDNTLEIMQTYADNHKNIKIVNVQRNDAFLANKKYALTLGIKAAKYDYLLFTDADCKAISKHWIADISSHFNNTKTIVLGYGAYSKIKNSLLNKLIRFDTLLTATQYLSFVKLGLPFMGVGRNLAYRKDVFFNVNGFMSHMTINSGDDDLFINQVATPNNTTICFSKDSFTESKPKTSLKEWITQKRRHITTANHYKFIHKFLLALFFISQFSFWFLSILLLITLYKWKIIITLIIIRFSIQYFVLGSSAKKLKENDILLWFPLLELFLIITQLTIFIANLFSKPNHWK